MRYLESKEVEQILPMFGVAVAEAMLSPCQKSKRGVVVFREGELLVSSHNTPKDQKNCIPPICYRICGIFCGHAEENSLKKAESKGIDLTGATMLHVEVKGVEPVKSDDTSCLKCSTLVAASSLRDFILWVSEGFKLFEAQEFHQETQKFLGVNK